MKLRNSKYNYFIRQNDKVILYNFLYKNIIEFSLKEFEQIEPILKYNIISWSNEYIETLRQNMFLVSFNFNEIEYMKFNYFKSLYGSAILKNIVLPTLSCNLACPYCYEYKTNGSMSQETIAAYINWLTPYLSNIKTFYIDWFGGEPLLSFDIIEEITNRIKKLQEEFHFNFSASITTNGVLLSKEIVEKFAELNIESVQITFDGDRQFHNRYKRNSDGSGTFDKLIENVNLYTEISKSTVPLIIRVNVTDDNFESIDRMMDRFSDYVKNRSIIFFKWVYESSAANFKLFSNKKRGLKPFENLAILYDLAQKKGFYTHNLDENANFNFCECDFSNHYTIDPKGNIYLCTHTFDGSDAIGNVSDGIGDQDSLSSHLSVLNVNPFNDVECINCDILPLCKGGCRRAAYLGKKKCIDQKDSLDEYVLMLYNKSAHNN